MRQRFFSSSFIIPRRARFPFVVGRGGKTGRREDHYDSEKGDSNTTTTQQKETKAVANGKCEETATEQQHNEQKGQQTHFIFPSAKRSQLNKIEHFSDFKNSW